MDSTSRDTIRHHLHRTRTRLGRRMAELLAIRTRDGFTLSPRVVVLTLAGTVVVVVLGAASPLGRGGASAVVRDSLAESTIASPTERQLSAQISSAVWGTGVQRSQTIYDAKTNAVTVTITLGGTIPHTAVESSAAQELSKGFCLMAQQAIWSGGGQFNEVTVIVKGPLQNEYGEVGTDAYAVAVVRAANGHAIDWTKQTPDGAWQIYDSEFIRTSFVAYV